jgi:hypothetical protein
VIDDCSTDNSVDVIRPFLEDPRVRLVAHEKNSGFAKSLIQGTEELSRGEFLSVISADDIVRRDDAFSTQVDLLRAHPNAAFCFSAADCFQTDPSKPVLTCRSFAEETTLGSREALHALLVQDDVWPVHSGTMIRAGAYKASGGYRRDITMPLDLGMWLALAMEGGFTFSPLALYGYRVHAAQMSAAPAKIRRNTQEVVRILRDACAEGEKRGYETGRLLSRAISYHLGVAGIADAFGGNRRSSAHRWLAAVKECPAEALKSRKLWVVAMRTALGEKGFSAARSVFRLATRGS